ncbi:MAG: DUF3592 domain-containing protein [Chitinophagaceae bacterium]|nr:MAG: DUF3592 domain-containing protein [Chitinophagaceae bacterium]
MESITIGIILTGLSLVLAGYLFRQYKFGKKVPEWPHTDAVIESVRIWGSRRGTEPSWSIAITFTFLVDDKVHTGHRLYAGPAVASPGREIVFGLEQKYKDKEPIRVSYNPSDPSYAVLYTGENPMLGLYSVGTGIFLLLGICLIIN